MAVVVETTLGDITIDLYTKERPKACLNFLKLCKIKYFNYNLFHSVQHNFIAQTGDPTGSGNGGESIFGALYGPHARFFAAEQLPKIKHSRAGLVSMVNCGDNMLGAQFFITLGSELSSLDGQHCVFGEVSEGDDVLLKLNEAICDETNRPYQDIRITHTIILDDPFEDPLELKVPDRSPSPTPDRLQNGRLAPDEAIDEMEGKTFEEVDEINKEKEAAARATLLEIIGDLPSAEVAPPENVLFVCKLNPVTNDDDLEIIFSRFGKIVSCEVIRDKVSGESLQYAFIEFADRKSCEDAYFKMDNVLIDDRRIHVDFSQSVAKVRWKGKGRLEYVNSKPGEKIETDRQNRNDNKYNDNRNNRGRRNDSPRRNSRDKQGVSRDRNRRDDPPRRRNDDNNRNNTTTRNRDRSRSRDRLNNRNKQRTRSRERDTNNRNNNNKDRSGRNNERDNKTRRDRSRSRDRRRRSRDRDSSRRTDRTEDNKRRDKDKKDNEKTNNDIRKHSVESDKHSESSSSITTINKVIVETPIESNKTIPTNIVNNDMNGDGNNKIEATVAHVAEIEKPRDIKIEAEEERKDTTKEKNKSEIIKKKEKRKESSGSESSSEEEESSSEASSSSSSEPKRKKKKQKKKKIIIVKKKHRSGKTKKRKSLTTTDESTDSSSSESDSEPKRSKHSKKRKRKLEIVKIISRKSLGHKKRKKRNDSSSSESSSSESDVPKKKKKYKKSSQSSYHHKVGKEKRKKDKIKKKYETESVSSSSEEPVTKKRKSSSKKHSKKKQSSESESSSG